MSQLMVHNPLKRRAFVSIQKKCNQYMTFTGGNFIRPPNGRTCFYSSIIANNERLHLSFEETSSIKKIQKFNNVVKVPKRNLQTFISPVCTTCPNKDDNTKKQFQRNNSKGKSRSPLLSLNHYNFSQRRSKVFVSKHNDLNVNISDIQTFCQAHGMTEDQDMRTTTTHVIIKECPFCHPIKGKSDNMHKLYVQLGSGAYFCHRCGAKGSWFDFKMKIGGFQVNDTGSSYNGRAPNTSANAASNTSIYKREATDISSSKWKPKKTSYDPDELIPGATRGQNQQNSNNDYCSPMPNPKLAAVYISNLYVDNAQNNQPANSIAVTTSNKISPIDYLTNVRGLNRQTLRKYGVGRAMYKFRGDGKQNHQFVSAECITFPWFMRASEVQEQEALRGNKYSWKSKHNENEKNETTKMNANTELTKSSSFEGANLKQENDSNLKESKSEASEDISSEEERKKLSKELGPWVTRRIKARALQKKSWQRLEPPGGGWGLFGWHTIPHDATEIVITEGEYDAMAVYQATGRPCVSLPNGCRSLPVEVLPMLERFETIYLWMDNDGPGREGAEAFAKKLGMGRALLVQPTGPNAPKDANEALLQGLDLDDILGEAKVVPHERIVNFSDLRTQVLHEIFHPEKYAGVKVPSLPKFTNIIKGFRRGEMTVVTGPTGSGKTTFLGQISLDFSEQGINTLWGSFEIKNTRLMHKLLQQFSRNPIPKGDPNAAEIVESVADKFGNLPLYFMSFHGGSDVDDVLDAMDYAVYVHDVEHIILDNMQFMLSRSLMSQRGFYSDKFDMQDIAVEKFRKFATEKNVHITLVVHPRKEDEGSKLGISSIYGSAKSTQEADTVLILQNDGRKKYMEVKKNRFDGSLGISPLFFQPKSGRYSETPDSAQMQQLQQQQMSQQKPNTPKYTQNNKNNGVLQEIDLDYDNLDPGPHQY